MFPDRVSWCGWAFRVTCSLFTSSLASHPQDDEVPKEPLPGALSQVRIKFLDNRSYQGVKGEFEKRPIWSKNALRVRLDYKKDKLKVKGLLCL